MAKHVADGRTQTEVRVLTGDDQVTEMALMLGALSDSTMESAREVLREAATIKAQNTNQ